MPGSKKALKKEKGKPKETKKAKETRERRRSSLPPMGKNLLEIREELGLTQEELAQEADCSLTNLSRLENNRGEPSFYLLYYLWSQRQVNPMYLLRGEEPILLPKRKKPRDAVRTLKGTTKEEQ